MIGRSLKEIYNDGVQIGSSVSITESDGFSSYEPYFVWAGSEYGVTWQDNRNGNMDIYFARLDENGNKL